MGYFNYHAQAKRLIKSGKLVDYRFVTEYNGIKVDKSAKKADILAKIKE